MQVLVFHHYLKSLTSDITNILKYLKIIETEAKSMPQTHPYTWPLTSWLGTGTSVKGGLVKLVLWVFWKEIIYSDGHQFHQYQQNEQSPLILTHWTQKRPW